MYSPIVAKPGFQSLRVKDEQISTISKCTIKGFHEHKTADGKPGWEICKHVKYLPKGQADVKVIDLR